MDLKYAFRQLAKNPGFTTVAVITLALGIGVNATLFTLINALVLKPVAGRDPERLVGIYSQNTERPRDYRSFSYPEFTELRSDRSVFEDLYAFTPSEVGLDQGEDTRRVFALRVSANFFSVFGTPVAMGRDFVPDDERTAAPVVIVGHAWWERRGAPSDIVGQSLTVNGQPHTIVGVAARGFTGTVPMFPAEVFLPLTTGSSAPVVLSDRKQRDFLLVGRLQPRLTLEEANARLAVMSSQLALSFPSENAQQRLLVARLPRMAISTNPNDDRGTLASLSALLMGISGTVLLIACLNLANLLLARGTSRRREVAIRLALGAARRNVLRQFLTEGALLATVGGALGLLLAVWTSESLVASFNHILPSAVTLDTRPDWRVVVATMGFAAVAVLFFAVGPSWRLAGVEVNSALKNKTTEGDGAASGVVPKGRHLLVVIQLALSVVLLVATGLFARSAIQAIRVDPGFRYDQRFFVELDAGLAGYDEPRTRQLYQEVLARVRALAGVESASLAATVPLGDRTYGDGIQRAGSPIPPPKDATTPEQGQPVIANYNIVSDDYFRCLGIALLRGREFEPGEFSSARPARVVILNSALAGKLWPGEEALGRRIQFTSQGVSGGGYGVFEDGGEAAGSTAEVVGVVESFRAQLGDHQPTPMAFIPYGQSRANWQAMNLHVRADPRADVLSVMRTVRDELRRIDPRLPILAAKTLEHHVATNVQVWVIRAGAWLFAALGCLALLLVVVGVYGVKAFSVACRTREIGIRMALGADRGRVMRLVLRDGLRLTVTGLAFGLPLAAITAHAIKGFLFDVQPLDPTSFALAPLVLCIPALVATWLPARRASRVDPMVALKAD